MIKMSTTPFAVEWPIPENRLLTLKHSINKNLFSADITATPEFNYFIGVYPNRNKSEEEHGKTWIFLHLDFKNVKKVEVDYTVEIESANISVAGYYVFEASLGWGYPICTTEELFDPQKKFIVDGKLIIKINGTFKYETDDSSPADGVEQQKWEGGRLGDGLWKNEETKDFAIIADGDKVIKVHKLILMQYEAFKVMLDSNMKEAAENKMVITDFSFIVVEAAMKLLYICNFTSTLSLDELISLQQFFDKYQLLDFKAKSQFLLISQISASTVCRLVNCSILTNSLKLKNRCMKFLMDSFASKTPLADIDMLDKDILLKIVKDSLYLIVETDP